MGLPPSFLPSFPPPMRPCAPAAAACTAAAPGRARRPAAGTAAAARWCPGGGGGWTAEREDEGTSERMRGGCRRGPGPGCAASPQRAGRGAPRLGLAAVVVHLDALLHRLPGQRVVPWGANERSTIEGKEGSEEKERKERKRTKGAGGVRWGERPLPGRAPAAGEKGGAEGAAHAQRHVGARNLPVPRHLVVVHQLQRGRWVRKGQKGWGGGMEASVARGDRGGRGERLSLAPSR